MTAQPHLFAEPWRRTVTVPACSTPDCPQPARRFMCRPHWESVPRKIQTALWAAGTADEYDAAARAAIAAAVAKGAG